MTTRISEFRGEYCWLSNFYPCSIILEGVEYPSVEHAYMSRKSDSELWKDFCATTVSPEEVKKAFRRISLIPVWYRIKVEVMRECLIQKYSREPLRSKLIATGSQILQEGNWWGDQFWGVDLKTGVGENNLGKLIMGIRDELIKETL